VKGTTGRHVSRDGPSCNASLAIAISFSPLVSFLTCSHPNPLAIFYAITQDRDDIVKLLLRRGANLLIVNNKGQSPCSMSVSHLQPATCELMFEKEHNQIREGGVFKNYRVSHCDGKQYGDLDPRFDIDPINYGEDIVPGLDQFHKTVSTALEGTCHDRQHCYKVLSKSFEPRSLRPTTKKMRQSRAEAFRANHSASAKRVKGPRLPPAKAVLAFAVEENKESDGDRCIVQMKSDEPTLLHPTMHPLDPLPRLYLSDLLLDSTTCNDQAFHPTVVDEAALIAVLAMEVSVTLELSNEGQHDKETVRLHSDARLVEQSWGLDCEWKPSRDKGRQYAVATLQLCSCKRAFLIDLQVLCQASVRDPETPMTDTEAALSQTLTELFMNRRIPIVGFGIGQDISKLALSFPHMPCFHNLHAVVDMDAVSHHCFPQSIHKRLLSLQKSVAYLLNKRLDKSEQCSNWQQRPLTASQIEYACLDAAVLPRLLREALLHFHASKPGPLGGFFTKYPHLLVSWRLSILNAQHMNASVSSKSAYNIENGTAKNMLSIWHSKQTWITGKREPALPEPVPVDKQEAWKQEKEAHKHEAKGRAYVAQHTMPKKKPLKLSVLSAVAKLPKAGQRLGYTKESCITALVELSVLESLTDEFYLAFNHRGGIIQMQNAWLLFVNLGGEMENRKFLNRFSGGGRFMTFTVDPRKDLDGQFYEQVSSDAAGQTLGPRRRILLFCRPDNSQYLFFGDCSCVGEEARSGNLDLLLELLDYETLGTTVLI
jgi:3'-5' exonuclease